MTSFNTESGTLFVHVKKGVVSAGRLDGLRPAAQQFGNEVKNFTAIVERDAETQLYVGYVPGFAGAHSQAETLDQLQQNLREVIEMLLEDENLAYEC